MIQGFKDGSYPVLAGMDSSASDEANFGPDTPNSKRSMSTSERNRVSLSAVQDPEPGVVDSEEYDPYAAHGLYGLHCLRE